MSNVLVRAVVEAAESLNAFVTAHPVAGGAAIVALSAVQLWWHVQTSAPLVPMQLPGWFYDERGEHDE